MEIDKAAASEYDFSAARGFALDDPIERYLPQLGRRRVLKPGATHLDDTEPARKPITIRHLMSHSSGLSLGLLDPGTLIFNAYAERGVRDRVGGIAGTQWGGSRRAAASRC